MVAAACEPAAASRWAPGAPTRRPRWPPPGPRTSPASPPRPTWRPAGATASPPRAPARTPSRCCTTTRRTRSGPRSTRSAPAPRCWSTPTTSTAGIRTAIEVAGPALGAIRIDSGDLPCWPRRPASCSTRSARPATRIVVTGDLDEYAIAGLSGRAGRRVRRGHRRWSPAPARRPPAWSTSWSSATAAGGEEVGGQGLVGRAQARASAGTARPGRRPRRSGQRGRPALGPHDRLTAVPLVRGGEAAGERRHRDGRARPGWRPRGAPYRGRD